MSRNVAVGSVGNRAFFRILNNEGNPWVGVAHDAVGLSLFYVVGDGTTSTLTPTISTWSDHGAGWYSLEISDVVYATLARSLLFTGSITDGTIWGEWHHVIVIRIDSAIQPISPIERSISDTNAITFSFPGPSLTLTGTRSINNAAYGPVGGTIAYLRTEGLFDLYTLTYNVADRPTTEGTVQYRFVESGWTSGDPERFVTLRVGVGNATIANQLAIINTLQDAISVQY